MEVTQKVKDDIIDERDEKKAEFDSDRLKEQSLQLTNGSKKYKLLDKIEKEEELVFDDSKNEVKWEEKEHIGKLKVSLYL